MATSCECLENVLDRLQVCTIIKSRVGDNEGVPLVCRETNERVDALTSSVLLHDDAPSPSLNETVSSEFEKGHNYERYSRDNGGGSSSAASPP